LASPLTSTLDTVSFLLGFFDISLLPNARVRAATFSVLLAGLLVFFDGLASDFSSGLDAILVASTFHFAGQYLMIQSTSSLEM
jgi:hypothetical protein